MGLDWLTAAKAEVIVAGGLGGLVRWVTLRESWRNGLISIVVGGICALYLSPLARPFLAVLLKGFDLPAEQEAAFSGFIMGIAGIGLVGFLLDAVAIWRKLKGGAK